MVDEFRKEEVHEHCFNINRKEQNKKRRKGEWDEKGKGEGGRHSTVRVMEKRSKSRIERDDECRWQIRGGMGPGAWGSLCLYSAL